MNAETADVVIVGGGIIGVAIAHYLAERRFGRICVLERSYVGAGSTGQSVASIEPLSLFSSTAILQRRSYEVFLNFRERFGGDGGFARLPLAFFVDQAQLPALQNAVKIAQDAGSTASILSPDEFRAEIPDVQLDDVAGVYCSPDAGFADPVLTLNGITERARAAGVVIRQSTAVDSLEVQAGRIIGVRTAQGVIAAPVVVLATGLWVEALLQPLDIRLPVRFLRHYVVNLGTPAGALRHSIIDGVLDFYIRPEQAPDSCLMGMALHNAADTFADVHDLSKAPPGVSQEMGFQVWEKVVTRFPFLEQAHLKRGYTGVADMTPDNQPLLGPLPISGLFVAAGMSGIGFKMAPGIGQLMADLIAGEAEAARILYPLRPTRADEGSLLVPANRLSTIA